MRTVSNSITEHFSQILNIQQIKSYQQSHKNLSAHKNQHHIFVEISQQLPVE